VTAEDTRVLENTVVGALIDHPEMIPEFLERIELNYLSVKAYYVAKALAELVTDGAGVTIHTVVECLRTRGELSLAGGALTIFEVWQHSTHSFDLKGEIGLLAERYALREAHMVGERLNQGIEEMTLDRWLPWARSNIDRIEGMATGLTPTVLTYLEDMLTGEDVTVDWAVPGLLPKGTATMLTAEEGVGKSTVLRQIAMSAMAGIQPFEPWLDHYEPQRVLLVDCEVSQNQLTRSLRSLWSYARAHNTTADTKFMAVESHQGGLNLSAPHDQGWLQRTVADHKATIVVVGPVYRFTDEDLNTEEGVRTWQRAFEPLMAEGISVVTEHHAGNGAPGAVRQLRPIGSSAMRRWFSQGIALRTRKCQDHEDPFCLTCQRRATVESWRGSRDEEARWPRFLFGVPGHVWWNRDEAAEVMF